MANGTTIAESGTELHPARPGEERGNRDRLDPGLHLHGRPQKAGNSLRRDRAVLFCPGGDYGSADSGSTRFPKRARHLSSGIQLPDHDARNRDDLLGRHANHLRDDQLPGSADDRSAGHGV